MKSKVTVARIFINLLPVAFLTSATSSFAVPLDIYGGPAITDALKADQRACLNVGDAVSCSAGMLNVLTGRSGTAKTTDSGGGYVISSPQGVALQNRIIVGAGGGAQDNSDIVPTIGSVENGYKTINGGDHFTATGKTGQVAGNLDDPTNNNLASIYDQKGTWDVSIGWLIDALTIDSIRRELMIGFDYNQNRASTGSVNYWALISVLDYDSSGVIQNTKNFEIKNDYSGYAGFTSGKTGFNDQPDGSEFSTVNTKTCYMKTAGVVTSVLPITGGQCPAGYESVNNATGDNTTEIIAFLPELNARLEDYLKEGFDTISVRMLFGCFGGTDPKAGKGYLSGGQTTQCDGGGNVDVYLLAGQPMPGDQQVPEPGPISLLGLALGILGLVARRRIQS